MSQSPTAPAFNQEPLLFFLRLSVSLPKCDGINELARVGGPPVLFALPQSPPLQGQTGFRKLRKMYDTGWTS